MKTEEIKNNNDPSDLHKDELGENSGDDTALAKEAKLATGQKAEVEIESSNKGKGPKGEDL